MEGVEAALYQVYVYVKFKHVTMLDKLKKLLTSDWGGMPYFCNAVSLFLFAVKCLKNTPAFFAERLHKAMKVGVCDKLHKLIVWRFFTALGKELCSWRDYVFQWADD